MPKYDIVEYTEKYQLYPHSIRSDVEYDDLKVGDYVYFPILHPADRHLNKPLRVKCILRYKHIDAVVNLAYVEPVDIMV